MSRIRVDQLVNQNSSGPTLAVEGLKIPSTKNLEVDGSIVLGGNTGLTGQVISRTTNGLQWASVPLTDNNTTYQVTARDGAVNAVTDKVIKLLANGGTDSEVALVAGTNVNLTRDGDRITINSSFTDTNTVTRVGANGANYTDGDVSIVGTGSAAVTQSGRTITINTTDTNTTYSGINGVTVDSQNRIQIGQPVGTGDPVQFAQITVTGNLVVQGTTTYNNVQTISSVDKFIKLNDVLLPTDSAATGGGVILRGDTDHSILWSNTFDRWDTTENFNLANTKEYQINGSSVLSQTTLGPNVVSSSLTSVGILSTGVWNAGTIGIAYGGTGQTTTNASFNALAPEQAANSGKYLTTDGNNTSWAAIPALYTGWTLTDGVSNSHISSASLVEFRGTGATTVLLDNTNKRITVDSTNTQYSYGVFNGSIPTENVIRLTDSANNLQDVTIAAGTGVTVTRTDNKLTLSVAQDLSSSASPTFAELTVTGTLNAGTYEGSAAGMSGLTGAASGTYGSSNLIPIITVDGTGRVTSISTSPNTGASAGTPAAGGSTYHVQYNSSGGLAGSSKFTFEPGAGNLELTGSFTATSVSSNVLLGADVVASNYLKLPNKTPSERDNLVVQNGTIVYNNSTKTVDMYRDGTWDIVGPATLGLNKIGELQDVSSAVPVTGQVLKWNGSAWSPASDLSGSGGGGISLSDLSVFTLNAGTSNLSYDNASGVFAYTPPDLSAYLTSYTETDPVFVASAAYSITSANITNWNAAYQWGDHSGQGYLTTLSSSSIADLLNVSNQAPSDGQVLKWSQAQGKWAPGTDNVGTSSSGIQLGDLSVSTGAASGGGSLTYDNTNGTFSFVPASVFSGSWNDLTDTPSLFDGNYNSLTNRPTLFSGSYNDLTDKPTIGATVSVSDSAPSTPSNGDLWFKSDEAKLKVRYEDGTSNQWVDALPSGISAATTDDLAEGSSNLYHTTNRARASISAGGDLAYNSSTGVMSVTLPTVFSGSYNDLSNKPTLFSGSYNDLTDKPTALSVTTGAANGPGALAYNQATGVLTYSPVDTSVIVSDINNFQNVTITNMADGELLTWDQASNKFVNQQPAFDGDYTNLTNKPTIPAAQVQSDWNASSGLGEILNKPTVPSNIGDLSNVSNATPNANEVLTWSGSQWAAAASGGSGSGLELVTSSVLSADVNKIRYDTNILQQDTIYRMIGVLEPSGNAYGGFDMNPSFYDTTNNVQYNDSYAGEQGWTSASYHDSICGPFPEMNPPGSYSYNQIPVVYYDEQGNNSWWLRTDAQNTIPVAGMYFVAEFSTCLGPWMHMTFGSMTNRYHTGTFTGSWSLNPMNTYINNMEYNFVQGGVNIKAGSKTWLYKYT